MPRQPTWRWRPRLRCSARWGWKWPFAARITGCSRRSSLLAREKLEDSGRHVLQHIEEFVSGVEGFEARVGVGGGELRGVPRGHHLVLCAVENQGGLAEIGGVLVPPPVIEQGVRQAALAVLAVVKHFDGAGGAPRLDRRGSHPFGPATRKAKSRRQQYDARHFRTAGGVEGGEVAPQAAAHQ